MPDMRSSGPPGCASPGHRLHSARSGARGIGGGSLDEAIDRVNAYLAAGADVGFVEGPTDPEELQRVGREVDGPVLYNFVGDLGTSPYVDLDDPDLTFFVDCRFEEAFVFCEIGVNSLSGQKTIVLPAIRSL